MKKLIFLLVLIFTAFSASFALDKTTCVKPCAKDFDCNNQTGAPIETNLSDGSAASPPAAGYTCGTASDPGNNAMKICGYIANGGIYQDHEVHNCIGSGAPINSGLIFLIIAGSGLGFFLLRKQQKSKTDLAI